MQIDALVLVTEIPHVEGLGVMDVDRWAGTMLVIQDAIQTSRVLRIEVRGKEVPRKPTSTLMCRVVARRKSDCVRCGAIVESIAVLHNQVTAFGANVRLCDYILKE